MASYYPPKYEGEDVGVGIVQQRPTSARRYTVDRPTGTQRLQPAKRPVPATRPVTVEVDYVSQTATRRGQDVLYASSQRRRPQPNTNEDDQVTTRIQAVDPASLRAPKMTRRTLLIRGGTVLGSLALGGILWGWGSSSLGDLGEAVQEGQQPATGIALQCGHGDSPTNLTLLHAYIQGNRINFVEIPGGDGAKSHLFRTQEIPASGDVSKWRVDITPEKVDGGRYQILLSVEVPGQGMFARKVIYQWVLVDGGQGYFRGVNPK